MMGAKILYIEDNADNRLLVQRILMAENYEFLESGDGPTGVALAAKEQPDLILMDLNLPEINGYDLTRQLRKIPGLQNIPIIAMTANVMHGDREKALEAGCNGYIPKPIDVDALPRQIAQFLKAAGQCSGEREK